ncbi:MAG: uroporphyrinogen-III synthase [Planctomycetaceae bacterium]
MNMRVLSLESRRAEEMRSLIERNGGTAFVAPSMRELPLVENSAVFTFLEELQAGRIEVVIFMTGVGARAVLDVVTTKVPRETFFAELWRCTIVVRGPKPVAVLREWGVRIDHRAPEPNTWRELLATLDAEVPLAGRSMALQEYGKPNLELINSLRERGAIVLPVPVYRWELPEDLVPLQNAVHQLIAGDFDLLLVTSAQQVQHLLQVAQRLGVRNECLAAAKRCLIGSIGPTATETLEDVGLRADFEPSHPKMGTLVKEILAAAPGLLAARGT